MSWTDFLSAFPTRHFLSTMANAAVAGVTLIPLHELQIQGQIGKGGFGTVYKSADITTEFSCRS
jgi:hypothetical protein